MNEVRPSDSLTHRSRPREVITDALGNWEPRRIIFNLVLGAVVAGYFFASWSRSSATVTLDGLLGLFILAVLANVCYCAAYLGHAFVQGSGFQRAWQRWRWLLFVLGTTFAAAITRLLSLAFFSGA